MLFLWSDSNSYQSRHVIQTSKVHYPTESLWKVIMSMIDLPISGSCHSPDHSSSVCAEPSKAILLTVFIFKYTTIDPVAAVRTGVSNSIKMTKCEALMSQGSERHLVCKKPEHKPLISFCA